MCSFLSILTAIHVVYSHIMLTVPSAHTQPGSCVINMYMHTNSIPTHAQSAVGAQLGHESLSVEAGGVGLLMSP